MLTIDKVGVQFGGRVLFKDLTVGIGAKDRVAFGRPIIDNQSISFTLADMKTEIDAARLLVHRAAWMGRNGVPFTAGEGSMSKLK